MADHADWLHLGSRLTTCFEALGRTVDLSKVAIACRKAWDWFFVDRLHI